MRTHHFSFYIQIYSSNHSLRTFFQMGCAQLGSPNSRHPKIMKQTPLIIGDAEKRKQPRAKTNSKSTATSTNSRSKTKLLLTARAILRFTNRKSLHLRQNGMNIIRFFFQVYSLISLCTFTM